MSGQAWLTAVAYLDFLNNDLGPLLENVPLNVRRDLWYLHDGAPAHYAVEVREWFDRNFPNKWIGRNGPVLWPPRSPDLNPCDFFMGLHEAGSLSNSSEYGARVDKSHSKCCCPD